MIEHLQGNVDGDGFEARLQREERPVRKPSF
jgi:hypothetical protein